MSDIEHNEQSINDLSDFITNLDYANEVHAKQLDRIADRQTNAADLHMNQIMGAAEYQREILRRLPFRQAQ